MAAHLRIFTALILLPLLLPAATPQLPSFPAMAPAPAPSLSLISTSPSPSPSLSASCSASPAPISLPISWPPSPSPALPTPSPPSSSHSVKAAYWPAYQSDSFPASAIDTSYFTHLYYAFLLPDQTTYQLLIDPCEDAKLAGFVSTLHSNIPHPKAMLSIGGGGNNATTFALMAANQTSRSAFIDSSIAVARKYGFDGLDLDWEFPHTQAEMDSLGVLFAEWRAALRREAFVTGRRRLLLTSAVYFAVDFFLDTVYRKYPAGSIRQNLDWVNAMCYDYSGPWDPFTTGAPAALYGLKGSNVSTSHGVESWIGAGVPAWKVVMGLPLYGQTWQLKDPNVNGIGSPAVGLGPGNGTLVYSALVDYNVQNNSTVVYDPATVSMYSIAGNAWIGYDDTWSVGSKIDFAGREKNLRGYFFWALGFDKGWAISKQGTYCVQYIHYALRNIYRVTML
ncbi:hypothetical protein ACLOJK_028432 [Asimina triloba]